MPHPSQFRRVGIIAYLPHAANAAFKPDAFPAPDHRHREHIIGSFLHHAARTFSGGTS